MRDNRWYDAIVEDFSVYTTHISFCIKYGTDKVIQDISDTILEEYGIESMYREIPHNKIGYYFEN